MKPLIEFIAKSIVEDPTQVQVEEQLEHGHIRLVLMVADEDMGRVIGRNGRVANAMRSLLRVSAAKRGTKATLDIG
ncbi:MAG TPA: KH domain-containing protein [Anaerolineales bacterium]|jgi:hypothetical protein